jgi:flagellar motor component MotA
LSHWKISFTGLDEADVVIVHGEKPPETEKTIVVSSDSADFMKWVKDAKSRVVRKLGEWYLDLLKSMKEMALNIEAEGLKAIEVTLRLNATEVYVREFVKVLKLKSHSSHGILLH